jgi:hypothetical protein
MSDQDNEKPSRVICSCGYKSALLSWETAFSLFQLHRENQGHDKYAEEYTTSVQKEDFPND